MLAAAVVLTTLALAGMAAVPHAQARSAATVEHEVPVTPINVGRGLASNSPALAADPTDPRVVALANRIDAPGFGCGLQLSGDGGTTWMPATPVPALPPGADTCYGPEIAFDADGTLHYLFVGLAGRGNQPMGVFLTSSTDRGRTFTQPRQVLGPNNFGVRMAMDRQHGRLHLVWLHATSPPPTGGFAAPPNPVMAAYSDDAGRTFSEPVEVSDPDRQRVVAPALAVGPDEAVHVGYYDLGDDARDYHGLEGPVWDGTWTLVVATSVDGGRTFEAGTVVDDGIVPHERVLLVFTMPPLALAAAPDGRVCAAWTDARHGDADVLLRCRPDAAAPWGMVRRVNDEPAGSGAVQYLPHLSFAPDGRLDAVFYDRRWDPDRRRNDVAYAASADSDARNVRVTSASSDPAIGQEYLHPAAVGRHELGSRIALLAQRDAALLAWTDTRNSVPDTTGQEIFAARLRLPGRSGLQAVAGSWTWLAVLLGAAAVVALAALGARVSWRVPARRAAVVLLVVAVGGAVWLLRAGTRHAAALPPAPPVVTVTMHDDGFDVDRPPPAGRVVFRFVNAGTAPHRVELFPLGDNVPPLEQQLRGVTRHAVVPFARTAEQQPGEVGMFAVDLAAGQRYGLLCPLRGPDGRRYALHGLAEEFRTPAGEGG